MINEDESGVYRNGGVKEYVSANYVRVLAKLDVLDAKNENETAEGDFEDENGSGSKMNIYGHVATIDLSDANNKSDFLDEKFIRCLHEPVLIQNAFEKSRHGSASSWTLRKLLEAHEEEEKRTTMIMHHHRLLKNLPILPLILLLPTLRRGRRRPRTPRRRRRLRGC